MYMKEFAGQHDGEEVLYVFRRHIIAMRKGFYLLLIPFVLASGPALIVPLLPYDSVPTWWSDPFNLLMIAFGGLGVGLVLFAYQFMGWYFSVFILTTLRLRQLTQNSIFGKSVIDLDLSKIQNISYNINGFTADVLGFGTIVVQTIVGDLVLDKVHHPAEVHNKLQSAVRAAQVGGATQYEKTDQAVAE